MSKKILIYKNALVIICESPEEAKLESLEFLFGGNKTEMNDGKPNSVKLEQNYDQITDELLAL